MAYCIYLRKSRADRELELQGFGETLKRHRDTLIELAKKKNLPIGEIYEEVVSGDSIAARPQMQRLLNDVSDGKWEGVLVMEIERLARGDTSDQGIVTKTFTYSNTLIITPMKTFNPTDEFDQEYFEFGLYMSRREYKTIKRRLHAGMEASCKEGNYIHHTPPFGYSIVKNKKSKGYRLEPKPGEAEIVKLIFQWYTKGILKEDGSYELLGTARIADKLNSEYSIKPLGGVWTIPTISTMLRNEHYLGYIVFGKKKRKKVVENGIIVDKWTRNESYGLYKGKHPALVSQDTFNLARERLSRNPRRPSKTITNPLAGVIKCGICGRSMYRRPYQKRGQSASLICSEKTCHNVSSAFYLVEDALLTAIKEWIDGYEIKEEANKYDTSVLESKTKLLEEQQKQLITYKNQLTKVFEAYENGIYDSDTFLNRQKTVSESISSTEEAIVKLNKEIANEREIISHQEEIIPKAKKILEIYKTSDDVQLKNDLMKSILDKVVYTKTANGHFKDQRQDDFKLELFPKLPKNKGDSSE